jgi:DNA-binding LacI/PurR family transcriptional regulator
MRDVNSGRPERRGDTGSVALVVPSSELESFRGPFVGAPLQGASSVVSAAHLQPVLLMDDGQDRVPLLHYLQGGHVDAAVVILLHESETLFKDLRDAPCPVVFIGRPTPELGEDRYWVDADHYGGARLATRTLLEAGRRRMVTITGPLTYLPAQQRLDGFRDELAEWGLEPLGVAHGDFHMQSGSMAMANLIHHAPDIDGLFAGSDLMAAGALRVLKASGRAVPSDVAVVGFDDTVVAATSAPPLTSINQPLREMGVCAAELALRALRDGVAEPRQIVLPTTLTSRESI